MWNSDNSNLSGIRQGRWPIVEIRYNLSAGRSDWQLRKSNPRAQQPGDEYVEVVASSSTFLQGVENLASLQ